MRSASVVSRLLAATAIAAFFAVAACSGPPSPRFATVLQNFPDTPPLPVVLSDETGLVTGIESAAADPESGYSELVARADPGNPNAFIVRWLGGACDNDATLTFKPHDGSYLLGVAIHGKFSFLGGCPAVGIFRDIRIVTSSPIPVDSIVVAGHT